MSAATLPTPTPAARPTELDVFVELMTRLRPGKSAVLDGVSWDEYVWFDRQRDDRRPNVKLTYDRGRLEVMTTSFFHDRVSRRLAAVVMVFSAVLRVPVLGGGSTTFRRADLERGLEPDECFYVQNIERVRPLADIDLSIHPAPDLAIEIDHASSSVPKQPIYAQLGVSELWRFDDSVVTFLVRQPDGRYVSQPDSRAFPAVNSAELTRFVMSHTDLDEGAFLLNCMSWATATFATPST